MGPNAWPTAPAGGELGKASLIAENALNVATLLFSLDRFGDAKALPDGKDKFGTIPYSQPTLGQVWFGRHKVQTKTEGTHEA